MAITSLDTKRYTYHRDTAPTGSASVSFYISFLQCSLTVSNQKIVGMGKNSGTTSYYLVGESGTIFTSITYPLDFVFVPQSKAGGYTIIYPDCTEAPYNISYSLTNCTSVGVSPDTIQYGELLSGISLIRNSNLYTFKTGKNRVLMGGEDITNRVMTITAGGISVASSFGVTGDIVILAEAVLIPTITKTVTLEGGVNNWSTDEESAFEYGEEYSLKLTMNNGTVGAYSVTRGDILVTMGGVDITNSVLTKLEVDEEFLDYLVDILIPVVTGDVVITCSVSNQASIDSTITNITESTDRVGVGVEGEIDFDAEDGYALTKESFITHKIVFENGYEIEIPIIYNNNYDSPAPVINIGDSLLVGVLKLPVYNVPYTVVIEANATPLNEVTIIGGSDFAFEGEKLPYISYVEFNYFTSGQYANQYWITFYANEKSAGDNRGIGYDITTLVNNVFTDNTLTGFGITEKDSTGFSSDILIPFDKERVRNGDRMGIEVNIPLIDNFFTLYAHLTANYIATSDFSLTLYFNSAEPQRVDKTNYLTVIGALTGVLRSSCSIIAPVIDIEYNGFPQFNYVYVSSFNRYYYVRDIVSISKDIYRVSLRVDVLMTYKDKIKAQNGLILRNENLYNPLLVDNQRLVENDKDISVKEYSNDVFTLDETKDNTLLTIIGRN